MNTKYKTFEFETVTVDKSGQIIQRSQKQAKYYTEKLDNDVTLDMVYIPGGEFMMGSPEGEDYDSEKPQHHVTVQPFYMGKYPVTQAQWTAVMGNKPSYFQGRNRPVEKVSHEDAIIFCEKLSKITGTNYRLPSEAQWEYACRAGTTTPFYFGETITTDLANYDYKIRETTDVGKFPPNAFGLYDMHGNVWEWCADDWHDNYEGAPTDGSAWKQRNLEGVFRGDSWMIDDVLTACSIYRNNSGRVLRGGSWMIDYVRSAYRNWDFSGECNVTCGFRVI